MSKLTEQQVLKAQVIAAMDEDERAESLGLLLCEDIRTLSEDQGVFIALLALQGFVESCLRIDGEAEGVS